MSINVLIAPIKNVLITSMPRATAAPDDEGRFYDDGEIYNALMTADAYGRQFE